MADTIYLNSFSMDKLICLCAHDFKHDFIEDSDRPKLALGSERFVGGNPKLQYHGTSSTTETVDKGETKMGTSSLVFPGTPLSEEKGYVVNPEDFPLACYIYLNIADMCKNDEAKTLDMFNKFCDNLGKINERIGLQKKKNEARQKKREALYAEAQQSSKKRRTIEGGNPVVGGSLISGKPLKMRYKSKLSPKIRYKYGQGTQNRTEKTAQRQRGNIDSSIRASRGMDQLSPERTAAASRPRRVPRLNYAERDDVGPVNSNKLIEWDKMLEIYKDWLSSDGRNEFYQDLNNLLNIQKPIEDDKRSFLIPSSEWEGYEHSGTEYIEWIGMLRKRGGVKNAFNEIYSVNVGGAFQMCSVAEQMLKEAKGSIVNISSHSGISGMGSSIAYAASKGALNTMTLGLARAFSPDVRVNAICPGFVDTDWMSKKLDQKELQKFKKKVSEISPLQEIVSAEDVAEATSWFALGGNLITGQLLVIDGGVHLTINSPIL